MKKILFIFNFIFCFISVVTNAQTFTVLHDTIVAPGITATAAPGENITNITGSNLTLKWHVTGTSFPADWLTVSAFGICDNASCINNSSGILWNYSSGTGDTFTSTYGANSTHDSAAAFSLSLDLSTSSAGTHWVTVAITDVATSYTKNITFVVSRIASSVPSVPVSVSDINLYPNPASNELNIVYDAGANVKNVVVYNIIGKVMMVYKVTNNNGANLNISNMPAGIYFVRLFNNTGAMIATKKFTRQ